MSNTETDMENGRFPQMLLVSGLSILIAYPIFLILYAMVTEGAAQGIEAISQLIREREKPFRIHMFILCIASVVAPITTLLYGGFTYWVLIKYRVLCISSVVLLSLLPALLLSILLREISIFFIFSFFCVWHSILSWVLIGRKHKS